MADIFPFQIAIEGSQNQLGMIIGWVVLIIILCWFWYVIWIALGFVVISIKNIIRWKRAYIYCHQKYKMPDSGEPYRISLCPIRLAGYLKPKRWWNIVDIVTLAAKWFLTHRPRNKLPFDRLQPPQGITKVGMEVKPAWLTKRCKITFHWLEQAEDDDNWRSKKITLRENEPFEVPFSPNFQFTMKT